MILVKSLQTILDKNSRMLPLIAAFIEWFLAGVIAGMVLSFIVGFSAEMGSALGVTVGLISVILLVRDRIAMR